MKLKRLLPALCSVLLTLDAGAQDSPLKPVQLVVGAPPGGASDRLARVLAEKLSERWKQSVIVENKPGRNQVVATEAVAKSQPDASLIGLMVSSTLATNPLMAPNLPYDPVRDIAPVSEIVRFDVALYAHPSFPASTIPELIALGKSEPGKVVAPTMSALLALGLLDVMAGTKTSYVAMKSSAPPWAELMAGNISLNVDPLLPGLLEQVRNGKLKLLATLGAEPSELAPDAPRMSRVVPGYDVIGSFGLVVRGGTPKETVRRIRDDCAEVLKLPDVAERLRGMGLRPVASTPEAYEAFLAAEMKKWAPVVRAAGVKLE
jgi:tripartite-type tricarboxylate transporter receptor subunit TctC